MKPRSSPGWFVILALAFLAGIGVFRVIQTSQVVNAWIINRKIDEVFARNRPTQGGLLGRSYATYSPDVLKGAELQEVRSRLFDLPAHSRILYQAYLDIAAHRWEAAVAGLSTLVGLQPWNAALHNDLGVVYLELANEEYWYLALAFEQFGEAVEIDPRRPEPYFNLALAARRQQLDLEANAEMAALRQRKAGSSWLTDPLISGDPVPTRVSRPDTDPAVLADAPDWEFLESALGASEGPLSDLTDLRTTASALPQSQDQTPSAILFPPDGIDNPSLVALRQSVHTALELFRDGDTAAGLSRLREAQKLLDQVESDLDRLWLRLNVLQFSLWSGGDLTPILRDLNAIIEEADSKDLEWLQARALTFRGSDPRFAGRIGAITSLQEAQRIFEEIGAFGSSLQARALQVLYLVLEGSKRDAFNLTHETFAQMQQHDSPRKAFARYAFGALSQGTLPGERLTLAYAEEAAAASLSPYEIVETQSRLAELYADEGDYDEARVHLSQANEAAGKIEDATLQRATYLIKTLAEAKLAEGVGNADEAERLLQEGTRVADSFGTLQYFAYQYPFALASLYDGEGRVDDARENYAIALQALERENSELGGTARLAFDERRRAIYEALISFELDQGNSDLAWEYDQKYRWKLWDENLDQLTPGEARPEYVAPHALSLPHSRVIEFTVLEEKLLIWVISDTGPEMHSVPVEREQLRREVTDFVNLIARQGEKHEVESSSRDLYATLLGPVEDLIEGAETLVIVPDRSLHSLPFAALKPSADMFLAEKFNILSTPTFSFFQTNPEAHSEGSRRIALGSANADLSMKKEMERVGEIYGIDPITGFEVTPEVFLDSIDGTSFFAYNGHAQEGTNSLSAFALLNPDDPTQRVSATEIARRRTAPNALVVLSSCDSSVGNYIGGVEFKGLTSAFLAGNAGSVVGSLWPVDSEKTTKLMTDFHWSIRSGETIAESLRHAQLKMIEEGLHPYYWAAFAVTGNRSALEPVQFLDSLDSPTLRAEARPSR